MNENITELVLDFREAMRHLWNSHAKDFDSEHRFEKIQNDYFYFSVLAQTKDLTPGEYHPTEYFYDHVEVVPNKSAYFGKLLLGVKNGTGGHDYETIELQNETELQLKFIEFFDVSPNRQRQYRYAKTYINKASNKNIVGNVLLIEADSAEYMSAIA